MTEKANEVASCEYGAAHKREGSEAKASSSPSRLLSQRLMSIASHVRLMLNVQLPDRHDFGDGRASHDPHNTAQG